MINRARFFFRTLRYSVCAASLIAATSCHAEVRVYLHSHPFSGGPSTIYRYGSNSGNWTSFGSASLSQRSTQFASDILGNVFTYNSSSRQIERLVGNNFQSIGRPAGPLSGGGYNLEVTNSGTFLLTRAGSIGLYRLPAGAGSWQSSSLGFSANLTGDYDPLTNRYVVGRQGANQFREINPDTFQPGSFTSYAGGSGEWRRMGSIVNGYLVENESTHGIRRWNMNSLGSGSTVLSQTGGDWLASGVDRVNQTLYTYDSFGGTFGIKDVNTGQFTQLSTGPNVGYSSIVVVNTDVELNGISTQSRYNHAIDSLTIGGDNGTGQLDIVNGTTLTTNGSATINSGSSLNLHGSNYSAPTIDNNGSISGSGHLSTGTMTNTGSVLASSGILTLNTTTISNTGTLGSASGAQLLIGGGTTVTNGGDIISGGLVQYDGATIVGGTLSGSGSHVILSDSVMNDVTINSALTVSAGQSLTATNGNIAGSVGTSGSLTVSSAGSTAAYSDSLFVGGTSSGAGGTGMVQVTNGGSLSVGDTLHIYNGSTVSVDATSTLSATSIVANGNLDWANGTLEIGAGQRLTGSGDFSGVGSTNISNGGILAPGNSTGTLIGGDVTWGEGGILEFEVNDFLGTAGSETAGWDLFDANSIDITATSGNPFEIDLLSLDAGQAAGLAANFDSSLNYSLLFATGFAGISGFNPGHFAIDTSGFQNSFGAGAWYISQSGNSLYLNFDAAAVPEPATLTPLMLCAFVFIGGARRRRR